MLYFLVQDDPLPTSPRQIVVGEGEVSRVQEQFKRIWLRAPTQEEMKNLVEDFVKEEILYREGLALGLDKDDLIIRRRMQQKLEFLNADLVDLSPATDDELQQYLDGNAGKYLQPEHISFKQIFFKIESDLDASRLKATSLLKNLINNKSGIKLSPSQGDATMLPFQMEEVSVADINRVFGKQFVKSLKGIPQGSWAGPVMTGYGLHLVYVSKFEQGQQATLSDVRDKLTRDFAAERKREANDVFYQGLRKRYEVHYTLP